VLSTVVTAGRRYSPCRLNDNNNNHSSAYAKDKKLSCR